MRPGCWVAVAAATATGAATGADRPARVEPAVSIKTVMTALTERASAVLWGAETDAGAPRSDADWLRIEDHAVQVALSGVLVERGVAGPANPAWLKRPEWRTNLDGLLAAAAAAQKAAKAKNLDALAEANGQLLESCEGCHKIALEAR